MEKCNVFISIVSGSGVYQKEFTFDSFVISSGMDIVFRMIKGYQLVISRKVSHVSYDPVDGLYNISLELLEIDFTDISFPHDLTSNDIEKDLDSLGFNFLSIEDSGYTSK